VTEDMTIRPRALRLFEYLEAVHGLLKQFVRSIAEYKDRRWCAADRPPHSSCALTSTGDEPWLMVSKTQVPPPLPAPNNVAAHHRTGITATKREPTFATDLDDQYAELKTSATCTVAKALDGWAAEALDRSADKTARSHVDLHGPVTMLIGNIP
jgi:hypothetical protein